MIDSWKWIEFHIENFPSYNQTIFNFTFGEKWITNLSTFPNRWIGKLFRWLLLHRFIPNSNQCHELDARRENWDGHFCRDSLFSPIENEISNCVVTVRGNESVNRSNSGHYGKRGTGTFSIRARAPIIDEWAARNSGSAHDSLLVHAFANYAALERQWNPERPLSREKFEFSPRLSPGFVFRDRGTIRATREKKIRRGFCGLRNIPLTDARVRGNVRNCTFSSIFDVWKFDYIRSINSRMIIDAKSNFALVALSRP